MAFRPICIQPSKYMDLENRPCDGSSIGILGIRDVVLHELLQKHSLPNGLRGSKESSCNKLLVGIWYRFHIRSFQRIIGVQLWFPVPFPRQPGFLRAESVLPPCLSFYLLSVQVRCLPLLAAPPSSSVGGEGAQALSFHRFRALKAIQSCFFANKRRLQELKKFRRTIASTMRFEALNVEKTKSSETQFFLRTPRIPSEASKTPRKTPKKLENQSCIENSVFSLTKRVLLHQNHSKFIFLSSKWT